ncbi:MAG TPA: S-layer homology domain-containing protein, partial [Candidatus Nanopelagicales bacterium]|nr:S-layer homology domain-containing protein [Candidatus Nanopelagicales bacterium]
MLSSALRFLSVVSCLAAGAVVSVGCAAVDPEEEIDENPLMDDDALGVWDRNTVMTDEEMLDVSAFTAAEVDAFLARPYPKYHNNGSCLSRMTFGGKSTGTVIVDAAKKYGLNPMFLLTHLQKESSLIGNTASTCSQSRLDKAFGCGCPDYAECSPAYKGFTNQTDCAAKLTRSYLDDLATKGYTIASWRVGTGKKTLDNYTITPAARAAAVLYTYTPWVGDKDSGGNKAPFGNYLFWKVWGGYANTMGYTGPSGDPACDAGFKDICGNPHEADIEWLKAQGLTSGCDTAKGLYCPDHEVTRGPMADFLARALGLPAGPDAFVDDDGSIYEASINAIAAAGITAGCDAVKQMYCPEAAVTRGQMAEFLMKAIEQPPGTEPFVDDNGSPYEDAINAIAAAGVTSGCDAAKKLYCPDAKVTRAQMAT